MVEIEAHLVGMIGGKRTFTQFRMKKLKNWGQADIYSIPYEKFQKLGASGNLLNSV